MKGTTMKKTYKSTSDHSQNHKPQPSAVAFANLLSDVFEACFAEFKEQKKQAWVKEQKDAGHKVLVDEEDGTLIAIDVVATYKF